MGRPAPDTERRRPLHHHGVAAAGLGDLAALHRGRGVSRDVPPDVAAVRQGGRARRRAVHPARVPVQARLRRAVVRAELRRDPAGGAAAGASGRDRGGALPATAARGRAPGPGRRLGRPRGGVRGHPQDCLADQGGDPRLRQRGRGGGARCGSTPPRLRRVARRAARSPGGRRGRVRRPRQAARPVSRCAGRLRRPWGGRVALAAAAGPVEGEPRDRERVRGQPADARVAAARRRARCRSR